MNTNEMVYTPEMGQAKPAAKIEARLSFDGRHFFLHTALELAGRGVNLVGTQNGVQTYRVTDKAYGRICAEHSVSRAYLLD